MILQSRDRQPTLFDNEASDLPIGYHYLPGYFNAAGQSAMLADIRAVLAEAPLFQQAMPKTGAPLSVKMSNAGAFGWVTDREDGYRYQAPSPDRKTLAANPVKSAEIMEATDWRGDTA